MSSRSGATGGVTGDGATAAAAPPAAQSAQQTQQAPSAAAAASAASAANTGSATETAGAASAGSAVSSAGAEGKRVASAKAKSGRSTRAALRGFTAASLLTSTLTGAGALLLAQPEVLGATTDPAYSATLDRIAPQAAELQQLGSSAAESPASRQAFEGAAQDLAAQIPQLAAAAPDEAVGRVSGVAGGLSTYTIEVGRAAASGSGSGVDAATRAYEQSVQAPLQQMQRQADAGVSNWVPLTLFGLVAASALGTLIAGAVSLARRTRRVFNVPLTLGIVLLGGVVAGGVLTGAGVLTWPAGIAGAAFLAGGIGAGVAAATGFLQRLQDYR